MGVHEKAAFRNAAELPALVSYLRERRCILFVGAGLSRPAGYPGWGDLMRLVVDDTGRQLGPRAGKEELDQLLAQGKFAEVADQCRTLLGRTFFGRLLRQILAREVSPPEATHRAIVETPYACIVTTNFDTLLEDAYARWSDIGIPKAPTGMELSQHGTLLLDGAFFILKAHGTIHDDDSMVFTSEDYRRITHGNPAFQSVMSSLLLTHAVLFVGYSLGDPNFRLLMDSQLATFGSEAPPRYALMENVGAAEQEILRRTAGIEVISFAKGAYGEVAGLLQYLQSASRSERPNTKADTPAEPRLAIRPDAGMKVLVLSVRQRDVWIDSTWYETTTRNLAGAGLPLEAMRTSTAFTVAWNELGDVIGAAIDKAPGTSGVDAAIRAGAILSQPLGAFLGELETMSPDLPVILDVSAELTPLPWEWMEIGASTLGRAWPVCRVMPGLNDASRGHPFVRTPLRALLIGDSLAEATMPLVLKESRAEVRALARRLRKAAPANSVTLLTGADASYARVLHELRTGGYDVVHFAGASSFDDTGSYLRLHDGRVGASELITLLIKRPPALLVLNALYTGFVPAFSQAFPVDLREGMSFDDHYRSLRRRRIGFDRAAARAGVGTFVGVMGLTGDEGAREISLAFYDALLEGKTAAHALRDARRAMPPRRDTTALQLAMSGYADLRLVPAAGATTPRSDLLGRIDRAARPSHTPRPHATRRPHA